MALHCAAMAKHWRVDQREASHRGSECSGCQIGCLMPRTLPATRGLSLTRLAADPTRFARHLNRHLSG
eukprot:2060945-Pyramimonas_sp.AAC.1